LAEVVSSTVTDSKGDNMATQTIKVKSVPLTIHAVAGGDSAPVKVESPAFANGDEIPEANSDYGDGVSPPLTWSRVPDATRSFAVIVEDPDVRQKAPFTHWLLYNLPGDVRELPASIPPDSRLEQFGGARQGRASNGIVGYFGPRPPTDDDRHHYHFQVFCLDSFENRPHAERD
jgi:Raf kinase inhibitor-like YbhB/YbcL family protein